MNHGSYPEPRPWEVNREQHGHLLCCARGWEAGRRNKVLSSTGDFPKGFTKQISHWDQKSCSCWIKPCEKASWWPTSAWLSPLWPELSFHNLTVQRVQGTVNTTTSTQSTWMVHACLYHAGAEVRVKAQSLIWQCGTASKRNNKKQKTKNKKNLSLVCKLSWKISE